MELKAQQKLAALNKKLASALKKHPTRTCENCKVLAELLAEVVNIYSDIIEGVIKKEIRASFVRRLLSLLVAVVRMYTKVS